MNKFVLAMLFAIAVFSAQSIYRHFSGDVPAVSVSEADNGAGAVAGDPGSVTDDTGPVTDDAGKNVKRPGQPWVQVTLNGKDVSGSEGAQGLAAVIIALVMGFVAMVLAGVFGVLMFAMTGMMTMVFSLTVGMAALAVFLAIF